MNLPYSVVAARIPWQPTPHRPSRSQATVALEDGKTVSFPKEANNVHTQGFSQSFHPLLKFTSTSCPPKDSSKSSQEWQRLALISYKYLIFSDFSSPFSPPDGRIWENDFIKSICAAP